MSQNAIEMISYILLGVSVLLASYAYMTVFQSKLKNRLLTMLFFFLSEFLIELTLRYVLKNYTAGYTFLCDFLFYIGLRIFYKGKRRYHLLAVVVMDLTSLVTEVCGMLLVTTFATVTYDEFAQYTPTFIMGAVFCNMFLAMMIMMELAVFKMMTRRASLRYLVLYIMIPVYQLILLAVYYRSVIELSEETTIWGLLILVFGILIDMFMVHTIDTMLEKISVEKELSRLYEQRQLELAYYESTQTYIDQMSIIRHEFNNRLQTVYSLVRNHGDDTDITELLDDTNQELMNTRLECYCENAVVNSVLFVKEKLAEQNGIRMDISAAISEQIEIAKIDLCSVFCNLLDNAIEACQKLDSTAEKIIQVKVCEKAGYLVLRIENPIQASIKPHRKNTDEGIELVTTKPDKRVHGYGTKLVQQIAREYDGDFRVEEGEGSFTVILTMRSITQ